MFYHRGHPLPAVLIFAAALYYLYRLFFKVAPPRRRRTEAETPTAPASSSEKAAIRAELTEMLVHYRRNRDTTRAVAIVLIAGATILMLVNPPLGIAIYMFAAIFAFLYYRNRKAVQLIEDNL
jgi:Na+/H+ antiporter NhaD/arsenite permease-like protein